MRRRHMKCLAQERGTEIEEIRSAFIEGEKGGKPNPGTQWCQNAR
jgi:hypothetical protein